MLITKRRAVVRLCRVVLLLLAITLTASAQDRRANCVVEQTKYMGWNAYRLSNGIVTLYVVPDIGGRTIQFQLGEHPFFWVNRELAGKVFPPEENDADSGWKNYGGSKVWVAPQGWSADDQWAGPPDPVLDGGRYTARIVAREAAHVAVEMTSPPDERSGVQLARTIHLYRGSSKVRVEHTMRNISRRRVRWGIWENAQLDTADARDPARFNEDFWAYAPLNPKSKHPKGFYPMFGQVGHASYQPDYERGMLGVRYDYRVGKVALDSDAGWLASVNGKNDYAYIQTFTYFPGEPYPDDASVEIWLNGAGEFLINGTSVTNPADPKQTPYLLESETLSPFAALEPAESYDYRVEWYATRCPKPVVDVTQAGAVNRRLMATVQKSGEVLLEGVFGVFYKGRIEAVFYTRDGAIAGRESLGGVEPNTTLRLARPLRVPAKAHRVQLAAYDEDGHKRGTLGGVELDEP